MRMKNILIALFFLISTGTFGQKNEFQILTTEKVENNVNFPNILS